MNLTPEQGYSGPPRKDGILICIPIRINVPPKMSDMPRSLIIALWLVMAALVKSAVTVGMDLYLTPEDQLPAWPQIVAGLAMGAVVVNALVYGLLSLTDLKALRKMREELMAVALEARRRSRGEDSLPPIERTGSC